MESAGLQAGCKLFQTSPRFLALAQENLPGYMSLLTALIYSTTIYKLSFGVDCAAEQSLPISSEGISRSHVSSTGSGVFKGFIKENQLI